MLKTRIFKALALVFLSHTLISGPADAAGPASCPAFTAAMIDATALVMELREDVALAGKLSADPATPAIACALTLGLSLGRGEFDVEVGAGVARVRATSRGLTSEFGPIVLHARRDDLTPRQEHACRAQVLQSFVWNQYCAPGL